MDKLAVVKIGGNVIEDVNALQSFLADFAHIQGSKILVHGGGKKATAMAEKMGIPVQMVEGRRITDVQNLDIITMLYGGKINKNIVAQLQSLGCNALGLSGADGNAIQAVKRPIKTIDYGFVGDIVGVNVELFQMLLKGGYTPVCCAVTRPKRAIVKYQCRYHCRYHWPRVCRNILRYLYGIVLKSKAFWRISTMTAV